MDISSLKHVRRRLKDGGQIIVVDNGAILNAEALAMIQGLHSRSLEGFDHHMEIVAKKGPEKFMRDVYCGFGHKSIGDLGDAVVIVENVSMTVPKAIQDWWAYNGTEGSTRYMDFSKQTFMNPLGTQEGENIQEAWRTAYLHGLDWLENVSLKSRFPRKEGEDENTYNRAIHARACDVMRSFLPAGTQTKLSWKMPLRQFDDELLWLRHHPLEEVCEVALAVEDALSEKYPSTFQKKRYGETEEYVEQLANYGTYFDPISFSPDFRISRDSVDYKFLREWYGTAIDTRPPKTELPKKMEECGQVQFEFLLDFGSFRDIQRHRAVTQMMPLLTTKFGFHKWYLDELGKGALRTEMETFIADQVRRINALPASKEVKQYYTGMGFQIPNRLTGALPDLVYLVELRGKWDVHPTLRERALQMAAYLRGKYYIPLHLDPTANRFDIRRGLQDITIKE